MSSVREQIVAAAATLLDTARPGDVPALVRTRIDSPSSDQLPAFTLYQKTDRAKPMDPEQKNHLSRGPLSDRELVLHVEVLTKRIGDDPEDKLADPMITWAVQKLAGHTFDGKAIETDEGVTTFEYEQLDHAYCRATTAFTVLYTSDRSDPEQAV